jgi:hypothetical protein
VICSISSSPILGRTFQVTHAPVARDFRWATPSMFATRLTEYVDCGDSIAHEVIRTN